MPILLSRLLQRALHEEPRSDAATRQPELPVTAGAELLTSLQSLDQRLASSLRRRILDALKRFKDMIPLNLPVDDWSASVQAFYEGMQALLTDDIRQRFGFAPMSKELLQSLMEQVERFVMRMIYATVFCPADCSDREDDLSLLLRTRRLRWITAHHLDACIVEGDASVRESLEAAYADLWQLCSCKSPIDKLESIVSCSCRVFEALHKSRLVMGVHEERPSSADDFLPAFIYVVIRAGVPQLQSNINYVARFANPSYLSNGERGYYFTSLCCATEFIRKLDADSLNLSLHEFNSYMSGRVASTVSDLTADAFACDGLSVVHENSFLMGELRQRQQRLRARTDCLRSSLRALRPPSRGAAAAAAAAQAAAPLTKLGSNNVAPSDRGAADRGASGGASAMFSRRASIDRSLSESKGPPASAASPVS